ncbi:hypothetical protein GGD66_004765 [Bradyrhizobium sp. CIR48]|nr:hypothetical protein [Bradyrhizobium sp. SBR1B]MBB4426204.1 hypothetical protein [Bradyrhizobium sp. CIR48]SFN31788.1 hypothetical protein SAMN05216573_11193 [Bradyrhizobium sp. Rc3b]
MLGEDQRIDVCSSLDSGGVADIHQVQLGAKSRYKLRLAPLPLIQCE